MRARLAELLRADRTVAAAIDAEIEALNHDPDALDAAAAARRTTGWLTGAPPARSSPTGGSSTSSRSLGLRVEDQAVFADTHRLILELVRTGTRRRAAGRPRGRACATRRATWPAAEATGGAYVVVEKILEAGEELPRSWPVAGTSGYDFLNRVNQLFVDAGQRGGHAGLLPGFTGETADYADVVHAAKLQIMREELAAEVERLTGVLADVCERHRRQRDHTRRELRDTLREVIAAFPVYRTYVHPGSRRATQDRAHVRRRGRRPGGAAPTSTASCCDFIGELLVGRPSRRG